MSEYVDTWIAMRGLLTERRNWTRRMMACDADGISCDPLSKRAVAWCYGGAAHRVLRLTTADDAFIAVNAMLALATITGTDLQGFPASFNDTHEHEEVLALLDKGIALGRASRTLPSLLDIPASPTRVNETV